MGKIRVVMDPVQRAEYIKNLLALDGMSSVQEDAQAAYCAISLTYTPEEMKAALQRRQEVLMDCLKTAGITPHDPASSPFSPDKGLHSKPHEIYLADSSMLLGARYFVWHNILPTTGCGIEQEKAKVYNRVAVTLMDKSIRISRMQPHRAVYLQYDNFEEQAAQFTPVFELLQDYDPGMGFNDELPVLLGFNKSGGDPVDLEEKVYKEFPALQYHYDGKVPIVKLRLENPELFYEKRA